jgi:hypothetical protein
MDKSPLSKRLVSLAESQTIGMAKKSRELSAQGMDIVNLSLSQRGPNHNGYVSFRSANSYISVPSA